MTIAIIDYGAGNLLSVEKAFAHVENSRKTPRAVCVTSNADDVRKATHIVLPGVGAFSACAHGLRALPGMVEALNEMVLDKGRAFLGICVGAQLISTQGLEKGTHQGLGWVDGVSAPLGVGDDPHIKIPHIGWNELENVAAHPVLEGLGGAHMYFLHSYAVKDMRKSDILATTTYGAPFVAIFGRDNMVGTQFHPEKSQRAGLSLISQFLSWRP